MLRHKPRRRRRLLIMVKEKEKQIATPNAKLKRMQEKKSMLVGPLQTKRLGELRKRANRTGNLLCGGGRW